MKKIGLIGAPGAGKTTLSAGLFYHLKMLGYNVELAPELIKFKVYQGADFSRPGFDIQNTLEQMALEEGIERAEEKGHALDALICEAPLCNGYFYASFYGKADECPVLRRVALDKIKTYDLLFFVKRPAAQEYVRVGRKESLEKSSLLEAHIRAELCGLCCEARVIEASPFQSIEMPLAEAIRLLKKS
jgi:dephospho-CoA kinase